MSTQKDTTIYDILKSHIGDYEQSFPTGLDENLLTSDGFYNLIDRIENLQYANRGDNPPLYMKCEREFGCSVNRYFYEHVGVELVNEQGKLVKRLAKLLRDEFSYKLTPAEMGVIGGLISRYKNAASMSFDITDKFNWDSGDFGDHGSCYWTCRTGAKAMMDDIGCLAIRTWDNKPNDSFEGGNGRCWCYPVPYHAGILLYNAYGSHYSIQTYAENLKNWLKAKHDIDVFIKSVNFKINNSTDGMMWINNGKAMLISTVEYPRLKGLNITGVEENNTVSCTNCGYDMPEDDVNWINDYAYCNDCCHWCECCEEYVDRDYTNYVQNYGYVCDDCLRESSISRCYSCEEYYREDAFYTTEDDITLCESCYENAYQCVTCAERYYYRHNCQYYDADGERLCNDCHQHQQEELINQAPNVHEIINDYFSEEV